MLVLAPPPTRPHDWALDLGLCWRFAPLANSSVLRLHHQPPSPPAQNHLDASSSATLVDRPLSTPATTSRPAHALHRGPRRCKAGSVQLGRASQRRDSRCVLVLPTSSPWPPSSPFSRPLQVLETPWRRDNELTRPSRRCNGFAGGIGERLVRCRSWRTTSSGSCRSLYVPLARSTRATGSSMGSCTSVGRALTSLTVRAGQSRPRWHPLLFSSRKLALSLAGRLSTALVDAHRVSRESSRTQAVQKGPSLLSPLFPAAAHLGPSGTGPTEAAPALTCP